MNQKGFLASLYDFSFTSLITTTMIKVVYVVMIVIGAIAAIGALVWGLLNPGGAVMLAAAPLGFLLWSIATRLWLELIGAVFRIMEANVELAERARREQPLPPNAD